MKETAFRPWLCVECGYMMDATTDPESDATPGEGDLSLCMNCGKIYVLRAHRWRPVAPAMLDRLPREMRWQIQRLEFVRRRIVDRDLTDRDKHA